MSYVLQCLISHLCEVVVEVQNDGWEIVVLVHPQVKQFLTLVLHPILIERLLHVQTTAIVFPRVAGSMGVVRKVSLENFKHVLFCAHLGVKRSGADLKIIRR